MSVERETEIVIGSPEYLALPKAQRKARLASVRSRSTALDHLHVVLPPDIHGEWVHNDAVSINAKKLAGFTVDDTYARQNAIHGSGTGPVIVSDVIFMVCPMEVYEDHKEAEREEYNANHGKKVDGKFINQKEEIEFKSHQNQVGLPLMEESVTHSADANHLAAALGQ